MALYFDPDYPAEKLVKIATNILRQDGIVVYPTDTVYGIGCDLHSKVALEKIYSLKNFKKAKPLSFICNSLSQISEYALLSNPAYKIIKELLPGPYTIILKATKLVPRIVVTRQKTVGIRMPANVICMRLVEELGRPIISTSASVSEDEILNEPALVLEKFGHGVDVVIDRGILPTEYSTIIDLTTDTPKVIREGKGGLDWMKQE